MKYELYTGQVEDQNLLLMNQDAGLNMIIQIVYLQVTSLKLKARTPDQNHHIDLKKLLYIEQYLLWALWVIAQFWLPFGIDQGNSVICIKYILYKATYRNKSEVNGNTFK